jgi:hypothetical protein
MGRDSFDDPVMRDAHWYELIAMVVVVCLMVLKPF